MLCFQVPPGLASGVAGFLHMAVSFNYRYLALFTDTGHIWMGLASLKVNPRDTLISGHPQPRTLEHSLGTNSGALMGRDWSEVRTIYIMSSVTYPRRSCMSSTATFVPLPSRWPGKLGG